MKSIPRKAILIASTFLYCHSVYAASAKTNCNADESVYFSCNTGKKIVSFCTSEKNGNTIPYMTYRFGASHKNEMEFSSRSNALNHKFYKAEVNGASNAATAVWFKNGDFVYALLSPVKGEPFVDVVRNGKPLSKLMCKTDLINNVDANDNFTESKDSDDYFSLFERAPK